MTARGFSVIELLIAAAVALAVTAGLFAIMAPLRDVVEQANVRAELDTSTRASLQQMLADIRQAGSGAAVEPLDARMARLLPGVVPLASLANPVVAQPGSAMRVRYVPRHGGQGVLSAATPAGVTALPLEMASRCATGAPACGFVAGELAVIHSSSNAQVFVVGSTAHALLTTATPLEQSYPAGSVVTALVSVTYGTRPAADGNRLVRISTGGAEQPIVDNVVHFEVSTDAADPSAARTILLKLRLQALAPEFRGPAGHLFARGGTATDVGRWVPDVQWQMAIALRGAAGVP